MTRLERTLFGVVLAATLLSRAGLAETPQLVAVMEIETAGAALGTPALQSLQARLEGNATAQFLPPAFVLLASRRVADVLRENGIAPILVCDMDCAITRGHDVKANWVVVSRVESADGMHAMKVSVTATTTRVVATTIEVVGRDAEELQRHLDQQLPNLFSRVATASLAVPR